VGSGRISLSHSLIFSLSPTFVPDIVVAAPWENVSDVWLGLMRRGFRWAIKEAAYKSLYPHVRTTFRSFDLRKSKGSGQPKLHLIGHTTSKPEQSHGDGDSNIDVEEVDLVASLSHDAGVVVGVVIAQRRG
jgi:hypothetical protein